ncbi:NAD(P)-dependent oxidoreductase [Nocardia alni]|uniref:NAD(P)-dependent oxidoreductase n=1 Tax=Nocardia alni TaxID=2815723 RepID=UPI001C229360|nr:NAD(P)-dependent oxidoreductase [Nocardia alni]
MHSATVDTTANGTTPVGFIGVGDMGGPIVGHIAANGFPTTVWARRPAQLDQFRETTLTSAASPAELAAGSEVIGLCVFGDADVREVITGPDGILEGARSGSVVVVHSTIAPDTCRELAAACAAAGLALVDAPVTGARASALAATLTVMIGGEVEHVERVRPVLSCYAQRIVHVGGLGAGQTMKTLNNVLGAATGRLACIAIEIAERLRLDPVQAMEVLRVGSAGSAALNSIASRLLSDAEFAEHARQLIAKDAALFGQVRAAAGAPESILERLALERAEQIIPTFERAFVPAPLDS